MISVGDKRGSDMSLAGRVLHEVREVKFFQKACFRKTMGTNESESICLMCF